MAQEKKGKDPHWSRRSRKALCAFLFCSARLVELSGLPLALGGDSEPRGLEGIPPGV